MRNALVPPVLDLTVDRYSAWTTWKKKWLDYALLTKLATKDEPYQCAMIRYTFTSDTRNIYEAFTLSEAAANSPNKILETLETFSRGIIN